MGEILVNDGDTGGPISILAIGDDQFVVAWTVARIITCARFSASGARLGDNFTVNGPDTPATFPVMAMLPSGFVVAWTSGSNLFLQALTADGTRNGPAMQINPDPVDMDNPPAITRLLDRSIVVCWGAHAPSPPSLPEQTTFNVVRAQVFNSDLTKRSGVLVVSGDGHVNATASQQVNFQPVVTFLTDGGFVVAWRSGPGFSQALTRFRPFNPNGTAASQGGTLAKFDLFLRPHSLGPLPDGGFCGIRFGPGINPGDNVLMLDLYALNTTVAPLADGSIPLQHQFSSNITHRDDQTISNLPMVMLSPVADNLVMTWEQKSPHVSGDQGTNIMAVMTGSGGSPGAPVKVNTSPARGQSLPCVTPVITDIGSILAFAFVDRSLTSPPPTPTIKARILSSGLGDAGPP
jgi:hypothetical protein